MSIVIDSEHAKGITTLPSTVFTARMNYTFTRAYGFDSEIWIEGFLVLFGLPRLQIYAIQLQYSVLKKYLIL
jgi:hypothetical protein